MACKGRFFPGIPLGSASIAWIGLDRLVAGVVLSGVGFRMRLET